MVLDEVVQGYPAVAFLPNVHAMPPQNDTFPFSHSLHDTEQATRVSSLPQTMNIDTVRGIDQ